MKSPILLFIFYLITLANNTFCQSNNSIDGIQQLLLSDKEDTTKVNHLNKLCREYQKIGNYKSTFSYADNALKLARNLNYPYGIANAYHNIGIFYRHESNYDKAMENYLNALKIREKISDKQGAFDSYTNLGVIYNLQYNSDKNNSDKSLKYFFLALKMAQEINDKQSMAMSYNNIGNIYSDKGKLHNSDSLTSYRNYQKALENYFSSLKLSTKGSYKKGIASSYFNIGIVYLLQKNYNEAQHYFNLALKMYEKINNKQGVAFTYINISSIYNEKLNYTEALVWLQKALKLAKEINAKEIMVSSYEGLTEISEKNHDYKNAYKYHQLYSSIKDSIFNAESSRQIAEMQTKYETEKKEKEIKLLNNENKLKELEIAEQQHLLFKNKILVVALITGFVLVVLISLLWVSKNTVRQKKILNSELLKQQTLRTKAIIETQEMERKRIAQDLHDGIGHKLTILKFNFEKLTGSLSAVSPEQKNLFEQTENILDETHKDVRTLSHSMMPKALQEKEFVGAISDLAEQTFANSEIKYSLKNDLATGFQENIQICLYRVLQELLNNILKYAQATEVAIQIFKNKDTIILFVEDNGIAIQNKDITNGIGLRNIEGRINVLNGVFTIEPGTVMGTVATIRIPLPNS